MLMFAFGLISTNASFFKLSTEGPGSNPDHVIWFQ